MRPCRALVTVATGLLVALASACPAAADAVSDKKAQAARIAAQVDALGQQESALAEAYDGALLKQQQIAARLASAQSRYDKTSAEVERAGSALRQRAIDTYVTGGMQPDFTAQARGEFAGDDPLLAVQYAHTLASVDANALDVVRAARLELGEQRAALEAAQKAADAAVASVTQAKRQVLDTEAQLEQTQSQVKGELAVLVQQAEEERAAAAAAKAQAELAAAQRANRPASAAKGPNPSPGVSVRVNVGNGGISVGIGATGPSSTPPPAAKSGASAAVAYAYAQLGKPYAWGAAGPGSFDCSGLTMMAWRAGGVGLPHNAAAQYSAVRHIPMSALQPGDLVFQVGLGHVGIYVGGGKVIHAPHTGDVVRVAALWPGMSLAGRP